MTAISLNEPDLVRAGRFVQFLLDYLAEEQRKAAEGGGDGLGDLVRGGELVSLPAAAGDRRSRMGALEAE